MGVVEEGAFTGGHGSWDDVGQEAEKYEKKRQSGRIFRYWLPPDAEGSITFIDGDKPYRYYEHNRYLNGSWKNWFRCTQDTDGECVDCEAGDQPYFAAAFTIIDHAEWKDKQGRIHKDEKKLFVAKSKVLKMFRKIVAKHGSLAGMRFDVIRGDGNSPSTGGNFSLDTKSTPKELAEMFPDLVDKEKGVILPYDYTDSQVLKSHGTDSGDAPTDDDDNEPPGSNADPIPF